MKNIKISCIIFLMISIIFQVKVYATQDMFGGKNITITVTEEDGTEKKYTLSFEENLEAQNINLKTLQVEGFDLYPKFREGMHQYNLTINEKIEKLQIIAETENENATIEVIGNDNLTEGNNTIKIIVTAEDGITKGEYNINTYISDFEIEVEEENKIPAIIAIIVLSIIIVALFVYIIKNNRKDSVKKYKGDK